MVEDDLFERLVAFGSHGVPVCHDNAYSEITFDGYVAPSFLATPGAREAGIELLSLSKASACPAGGSRSPSATPRWSATSCG